MGAFVGDGTRHDAGGEKRKRKRQGGQRVAFTLKDEDGVRAFAAEKRVREREREREERRRS